MILATNLTPILTPVILVGVFGLIVLIVYLIRKKSKFFKDDEKPKTDKEIAKEELDRLLQPIEEELQPLEEEKTEKVETEEPKEKE